MDKTALDLLDSLAKALDDAVGRLADLEEKDQRTALALKDGTEEYYAFGIKRMVKLLKDDIPNGAEVLRHLSVDPVVRTLLLSTGILRTGPTERAHRTLESVRPYLNSHGGDVELVKVEPPIAYVRLIGACNGCSMAAQALSDGVRETLVQGVEEIDEVEVLSDATSATPVEMSRTRHTERGWYDGPRVGDVPRFGVLPFTAGEYRLVVTSVDGELACFRNECAHLGMELDGARVDGDGTLTCPWHGFRYDATTGECITAPGVELEQVPWRVQDDRIRVKLTV